MNTVNGIKLLLFQLETTGENENFVINVNI